MREANYLNLLITLSKDGKFPGFLLKCLVSSPVVNILNSKPMKPLFKVIYIVMKTMYRTAKKIVSKA